MATLHICVSARPVARELRLASDIADGIEIKLDWEHLETDLADRTLAEHCEDIGIDLGAITSVHLPPGTNRRHGMSVAPGNVGKILAFVHRHLGDGIETRHLTVHSVREFDYRHQVDRLATLRDETDHRVALENTPDDSYLYTPLDLAVFRAIADHLRPNLDVSFVLDTGHLPTEYSVTCVDGIERVLDRLDDGISEAIDRSLDDIHGRMTSTDSTTSQWRPAIETLRLVGDDVAAVHLNDPISDGLPAVGSSTKSKLRGLLRYCLKKDIPIILEPEVLSSEPIETTIHELRGVE